MRAVDARQRDERIVVKSPVAPAGSLAKTSSPTRSPRSRTAAASAAWSTTSPRAVLMKIAPGFSRAEQRRVDQALRLRAEREVDAEDVGARRDVVRRRRQLDATRAAARCSMPSSRASCSVIGRSLAVEAPAPEHDVQAEPGGAADHLLADAADAEQAERLAVEALRLRVLLLVPLARRAARRRCRECGDRARGSARRPARRPRSRSCPDSSRRRCRACDAPATSMVL